MRVAVFGGSFDPIHKAHTEIARLALAEMDLEGIIFVPAWQAPHKRGHFAKPQDRLEMLKIALNGIAKVQISLYEIDKGDKVYSYQTLDHFQFIYPNDEIFLIIGSDSLNDLPTWKNIDYLASKYRFIMAKRLGISSDERTPFYDRCLFLSREIADISSTQIRTLLNSDDKKARAFLDEKVYRYIKDHGLYSNHSDNS